MCVIGLHVLQYVLQSRKCSSEQVELCVGRKPTEEPMLEWYKEGGKEECRGVCVCVTLRQTDQWQRKKGWEALQGDGQNRPKFTSSIERTYRVVR